MAYFILGNIVSTHSPSDTEGLRALIKGQSRKEFCSKSGTDGPAEIMVVICDGKDIVRGLWSAPVDKLQKGHQPATW